MGSENTTIKISKKTKERLDKLKVHHRESYEEILQRMLNILSICRIDPAKAQVKLKEIEKLIRANKTNL